MDLDERFSMNEKGRHKELRCDICNKWADEFDMEIIQDLQVCVHCADFTFLRIEGFLKSARETVRQLIA